MTSDSDIEVTPKLNIEVGDEVASDNLEGLEEKYSRQMRQIVSQKIELPISTLVTMIEKQINLSPEFQRRGRWDVEKQSRFIESIIMNVPIPPVFLGEDKYGKYVVLDGRQRLTAVFNFLRNDYALKHLKVWPELNTLRMRELEAKGLDSTLTRRFIPAVVILRESTPEVKYDVFDRLNTGGVQAVPMEIRNAIYAGKFNRTLHSVTQHPDFLRIWDIPSDPLVREKNPLYSTMADLELALRFFALRKPEEMQLRFKDHLSNYMSERNKAYETAPELQEKDITEFNRAVSNTWNIYGHDAFVRPQSGLKSAPLADAHMIALSTLPEQIAIDRRDQIREEFSNLLSPGSPFDKATSSGTNGKNAVFTRITLAREAVERAVRI